MNEGAPPAVLDRVFLAKAGAIRSYLRRALGNDEDVEDCVLEIQLGFLTKGDASRPEREMTAYLWKVARSKLADSLSARSRFVGFESLTDAPGSGPLDMTDARQFLSKLADSTVSQSERLYEIEAGEILSDAINTLPRIQRRAYILSEIQGRKPKDCARIMVCSLDNVRQAVRGAEKNLRKALPRGVLGDD